LRVLNQGSSGNLHDDIVDADLEIRIEILDALPHFDGAIHFNFGSQEEMRYRSK